MEDAKAIVLLGYANDPILEIVNRHLVSTEHNVIWLDNIISVQLTFPVGALLFGHSIVVNERRWVFSEKTRILLVDIPQSFSGESNVRSSHYRISEFRAAWLAFLITFPGWILNRPSCDSPALHYDALLSRATARSLGISTLNDTIMSDVGSIHSKETQAANFACIDIATSETFWHRHNAPRSKGSLFSQLDYPKGVDHLIAVRIGNEYMLFHCDSQASTQVERSHENEHVFASANQIFDVFNLDYAYGVFIQNSGKAQFSRILMQPPSILGQKNIEIIALKLASKMAAL